MSKLYGPDGKLLSDNASTAEDKIINSFFCGQIQSLHYLIYFLFRSQKTYNTADIFRFIEARYCWLVREYPNFYNQIVKNERELTIEMDHYYHKVFVAMIEFFREVDNREAFIK